VRDFLFDLITKDFNGGALDAWLKEADEAYDSIPDLKAVPRHKVTLDFYVDEFSLTLAVSRFVSDHSHLSPALRQSSADTIEVKFMQPMPYGEHEYQQPRETAGYRAPSQLIRRLHADNLRGWGACLIDNATV
jgi:excisionase family DNA binding protein